MSLILPQIKIPYTQYFFGHEYQFFQPQFIDRIRYTTVNMRWLSEEILWNRQRRKYQVYSAPLPPDNTNHAPIVIRELELVVQGIRDRSPTQGISMPILYWVRPMRELTTQDYDEIAQIHDWVKQISDRRK